MSQPYSITERLREWIVGQVRRGEGRDGILRSMFAAGWSQTQAMDALEQVLREHVAEQARLRDMTPASAVPSPDLSHSPSTIDVLGHQVKVVMSLADPQIVVFANLLSEEECDGLMALASPRLSRSRTVAVKTGGEETNPARTSRGMFFSRGENALVLRIEQRLALLLNWPIERGEGLQVLHYLPGTEYQPHYDYFDPEEPGTASVLQRGGQRVGTVVMYLNQPEKGGATQFTDLFLEVAPQRGHAVFFSYDRPHPSTRTLHAGAPVLAGEKWIATKWLRQQEFS